VGNDWVFNILLIFLLEERPGHVEELSEEEPYEEREKIIGN